MTRSVAWWMRSPGASATQVVRNDFEPAYIDAADATSSGASLPVPGFAEMPVTLSGANGFLSADAPAAGRRGQPVSVHYATADGTATAGQDYVATSGTLTFDPADPSTTKTIEIPILADTVADDGETVVIHLSAPVNGVVRTASATLTITDTPPAPSTDVVVRPGSLHGWAVDFSSNTVRPGFVTGPGNVPLGEGAFRFDTGPAGGAAAGSKVELSSGGLNGQRVADLSELSFDVYLEEGDSSVQPYLVVKIDGDGDGSIDTTFSYRPGPIELDTWTSVDAINSTETGSAGWQCLQSSVVTCPANQAGITWPQVLELLPANAVFKNSLGFPRSLIFTAGQSASAEGVTVRGVVDAFTWGIGDAGRPQRLRAGGHRCR